MSGGDGTGPSGKGPFTGRSMGRSSGGRGMGRGAGRGRGMGQGHGMGIGRAADVWPLPKEKYQSHSAQPK